MVHLALKLIRADEPSFRENDRTYRSVDEQLLPGIKWLDYRAIQGICLSNEKQFVDRIEKVSYSRFSREEIQTTLRLAGITFAR